MGVTLLDPCASAGSRAESGTRERCYVSLGKSLGEAGSGWRGSGHRRSLSERASAYAVSVAIASRVEPLNFAHRHLSTAILPKPRRNPAARVLFRPV